MRIRCAYCGQFIALDAIATSKICVEFIPDTHFTTESIKYYHRKCINVPLKQLSNERHILQDHRSAIN